MSTNVKDSTVDSSQVLVGSDGAVRFAPFGTKLPASLDDKLPPSTWLNPGYLSTDGIEQEFDGDTEDIEAWQNGSKIRVLQKANSVTVKFTMIETNDASLKLFTNDPNASLKDGYKLKDRQPEEYSFVFDILDGDNVTRKVFPRAQVTEKETLAFKNDEPIGYGVTIECYADNNGVKEHTQFGKVSADGSSAEGDDGSKK